jgi:probable phosphoglycerate mutase
MKLVAFFIRHGETDLNNPSDGSAEKFRGDIDLPLNEKGEAQAAEIPQFLAGYKLSALYHSGMHRTMQTAAPLAKAKGVKPEKIENFDSLDTGDFSGLPKTKENRDKLNYYRDHPDEKIPGGESVQHFRDRVDPIIKNVIKIGQTSGAPAAAVVHGSVIREISRLFAQSYDALKVEPGGIIGVFTTGDGSYKVEPLVKEDQGAEDMDPAGS